jgi:hypothetical protein
VRALQTAVVFSLSFRLTISKNLQFVLKLALLCSHNFPKVFHNFSWNYFFLSIFGKVLRDSRKNVYSPLVLYVERLLLLLLLLLLLSNFK